MTVRTLAEIKALFETGDIPSGQDFEDLVDSLAALENLQTGAALEGQALEADGSGGADVSGVKEYLAILTQSGTDAPIATVLKNTLAGALVWTRDDVGIYSATLAGAFSGNVGIMLSADISPLGIDEGTTPLRKAYVANSDSIQLHVGDLAIEDYSDALLAETMIWVVVTHD